MTPTTPSGGCVASWRYAGLRNADLRNVEGDVAYPAAGPALIPELAGPAVSLGALAVRRRRARARRRRSTHGHRGQAAVATKTGPPNAVTRFVPLPSAANSTGAKYNISSIVGPQVELEEWRWGKIPATLRSEINTWVIGKVRATGHEHQVRRGVGQTDCRGLHDRARPVVGAILKELLADPAAFLSNAFGQEMSP
jgi:hypothetical protein